MGALAWIAGIIAALGFAAAGGTKLIGHPMAKDMAAKLGYENLRMLIGGAEVLGAVGLIAGLLGNDWEFAGLLAGIGLIGTMLGAAFYHNKAGDKIKDMAPALVMLGLVVLYLAGLMGN